MDPRIERGLKTQLAALRKREAAGERHIGWKAAFRTQAAMDLVGIDRPLVGFMTDRSLLAERGPVSIGGLVAPEFDLEIAVTSDRDIEAGSDLDTIRAAMGALTVAIELNDYAPEPEDPEPVLAENVFHRGVILGSADGARRSWPGYVARVELNGSEVHRLDHPHELPGELAEVIQEMADLLAVADARIRAGDVIITGGIVAPVKVAPGDRVRAAVDPLGVLEFTFTQ